MRSAATSLNGRLIFGTWVLVTPLGPGFGRGCDKRVSPTCFPSALMLTSPMPRYRPGSRRNARFGALVAMLTVSICSAAHSGQPLPEVLDANLSPALRLPDGPARSADDFRTRRTASFNPALGRAWRCAPLPASPWLGSSLAVHSEPGADSTLRASKESDAPRGFSPARSHRTAAHPSWCTERCWRDCGGRDRPPRSSYRRLD